MTYIKAPTTIVEIYTNQKSYQWREALSICQDRN